MSSDGNLIKMIFDGIWTIGEHIFNLFIKKEPLDIFFHKVCLCNKDNEYPKVVDKVLYEDEYVYKISCPVGLGKGDFEKYDDALEIYLGKKIEVQSSKGYIYIK